MIPGEDLGLTKCQKKSKKKELLLITSAGGSADGIYECVQPLSIRARSMCLSHGAKSKNEHNLTCKMLLAGTSYHSYGAGQNEIRLVCECVERAAIEQEKRRFFFPNLNAPYRSRDCVVLHDAERSDRSP